MWVANVRWLLSTYIPFDWIYVYIHIHTYIQSLAIWGTQCHVWRATCIVHVRMRSRSQQVCINPLFFTKHLYTTRFFPTKHLQARHKISSWCGISLHHPNLRCQNFDIKQHDCVWISVSECLHVLVTRWHSGGFLSFHFVNDIHCIYRYVRRW
jgi:hypothetical protein